MYQGDYLAASLVVFNFNTASFTDGSPITLGGSPALSVYKNSTTESTTGITLTVDYDSRTGMHHVAIDTSADGTFYAAGNDFDVIITTGTVGGTSVVGRKVGSFSLENRTQKSDVRKWNGTAVATPDTAGYPKVTHKSGTGTGEINLSAGVADANAVKIAGDTNAANVLQDLHANGVLRGTVSNAITPTSSDFTLTCAQMSGTADHQFENLFLYFTSGANQGIARVIGTYLSTNNEVKFSGLADRGAFPSAPAVGDTFKILAASN